MTKMVLGCNKTMNMNGRLYSKTCVKRPLKIDKTKILMTTGNLIMIESIAEMVPLYHSSVLLTYIKG